MCGRFALYTAPNKLAELFSASLKYDIELSYNIAPSRIIPGLIAVDGERWISNDKTVESCCVITMAANTIISKIHDRMPVIIPPEHYDQWLNNSIQDVPTLKHFFENNAVSNSLITHPVSTRVNNARFDDQECIRPL